MLHPLHFLAADQDIPIAPSGATIDCAICGAGSPYPAARQVKSVSSPDMLGYLASHSGVICSACHWVTGGKPSKTNPPLRSRSIIREPGQPMRFLSQPDWWDIISAPRLCVLSWATGGKKQHALSAGWSTPTVWRVGTDDGMAEWEPNPALLDAVDGLRRRGIAKTSIMSGIYRPRVLADHGDVIAVAEPVLKPYRGGLPLDLICFAARTYEKTNHLNEGEANMLSETESAAVDLLASIAWGSRRRVADGKVFWSSYYLARIEMYFNQPLNEFVSRLLSECDVDGHFAAPIAADVARYSQEQADAIRKVIKNQTALLHALALDKMSVMRAAKPEEDV